MELWVFGFSLVSLSVFGLLLAHLLSLPMGSEWLKH